MKYKDIIVECSLLGDFRELDLSDKLSAEKREAVDVALKLACWLNSVEKKNVKPLVHRHHYHHVFSQRNHY